MVKYFLQLTILLVFISSCSTEKKQPERTNQFVKVNNTGFYVNGKPYYFLGANFWYGINLGSEKGGQRTRLIRELDRLQNLGITNLRIVGLSEGPDDQPYRMLPAVQTAPGKFDEDLLNGLDYLLSEMAKRKMYAVVCLGNFWPWSGGFGQYMLWSKSADSIPYPPPHPGGDWDRYQKFSAKFYSDTAAVQMYYNAVKKIVTRKNSITKVNYKDDPTIMSWQLCNEPRGMNNQKKYNKWIDSSAALIKQWDPNHLVSAGTEGYTSGPEYAGVDVKENNNGPNIDYVTCHVWVENWGWYDPKRNDNTYDSAVFKMEQYLKLHVDGARKLGKPLVIEEFGLARNDGNFSPSALTTVKDHYYSKVFQEAYNYASLSSPVAGVNFWAWSGEGRPKVPGTIWKKGDPFTGDPPHELQGWYSVYDTDTSTQLVIKKYANKMNSLN
ncbi:MAG: cellulase family glycosylhydrolase [Sporocytophaga sp.]|uniref:glycoside hydrolase 5 family protein n=1 Tax=Sporocytophaga sp. TaxID=2231183 RepID=UPI001B140D47|nr:cellulase family glycosylhydrolase [Sporocytophaga sp.]MBO9701172.1 cellulase family glycosylhydrolase [Sporocytophaga sp.]